MAYVPLGVLAATVSTPLASMLKGPVVIGVTSVFADVTALPFKVSFAVTSPPVDGTVSSFATIVFPTTTVAVAVSQFAGFAPTSHIW